MFDRITGLFTKAPIWFASAYYVWEPREVGDVLVERDALGGGGGLKPRIGHNIGSQAPIGTRSAWAPSRA